MSDKPYIGFDDEKIDKIMKPLLNSKKDDPDYTKFYQVKDGVDYCCTTGGMAFVVLFKNKRDIRDGTTGFVRPLANKKREERLKMPDFPDVHGLLFDIDSLIADYNMIQLNDINQMIKIHEAIEKTKDFGRQYHTAQLDVLSNGAIQIKNYDNWVDIKLHMGFSEEFQPMTGFNYNFTWMKQIWKTFKNLKADKVKMYYKGLNDPLFFISDDVDYHYIFAIKRVMVR